ncbi:MAG: hypothetical protein ACOX6J_06820, partial [Oscillospiraceae bacterium]
AAGRLADAYGLSEMMRIMSLPAFFSGVMFLIFTLIYNRKHPEKRVNPREHLPYEMKSGSAAMSAIPTIIAVIAIAAALVGVYCLISGNPIDLGF